MATAMAAPPAPSYPLTFNVEYPEELSRGLIFVKWLLAIPHLLVLYALGVFQNIITLIALFSILFTKRYPQGLFDFWVGINRWNANITAYIGLMRDEYPPFSWDPGKYPVIFDVAYPQELGRFMPLIKWLLALPHYIVLALLFIVAIFAWIAAWFAILFTGRFPRGLFDFIVGVLRWNYRVSAYAGLARDEYPPFSMS